MKAVKDGNSKIGPILKMPTSYSLTIKFGKLRKHRGTPPSFEKRFGWKTQAKACDFLNERIP